jgi:hypothetical protein
VLRSKNHKIRAFGCNCLLYSTRKLKDYGLIRVREPGKEASFPGQLLAAVVPLWRRALRFYYRCRQVFLKVALTPREVEARWEREKPHFGDRLSGAK